MALSGTRDLRELCLRSFANVVVNLCRIARGGVSRARRQVGVVLSSRPRLRTRPVYDLAGAGTNITNGVCHCHSPARQPALYVHRNAFGGEYLQWGRREIRLHLPVRGGRSCDVLPGGCGGA